MSCKKGFTIIELIMVIVISSVLMAIVIPKTGSFTDRSSVVYSSKDLREIIRNTQIKAINESIKYKITFANGSSSINVDKDSGSGYTNISTKSLANSATVNTTTLPNNVIEFDSKGSPVGNAGQITLQRGAHSITITIENETGIVTIPGF